MTKFVTLAAGGAVDVVYLYDPRPGIDATEVPDEVHAGWSLVGGAWTAPAAEEPVPAVISRRQCAAQAFAAGLVTSAEAIAWTATATPPAAIEAAFTAMAGDAGTYARIDFAADIYERAHPLVAQMVATLSPGAVAADIDAFFRAAGAR